jgi:molecular chaperone GrpE (heat shock protein)
MSVDGQTEAKNTVETQPGQVANTTLPAGSLPTSAAKDGTPAATVVKTYTQQELDQAIQKARVQAGRDEATLRTRESTIAAREAKIKEAEEAREAAELEAVKNDPAKLDAVRLKQEARRLKAEAEQARYELEKDKAEVAEYKKSKAISDCVTELKCDAMQLTLAVEDLGITDPAKIKALAKRMFPQAEKPGEQKSTSPNPSQVFDGRSNGGSTDQWREGMTTEEYANLPSVKARYK